MKKLLTGNEAFAYGAYLAGAKIGAAYPGTPSTEIMENFSKYQGVYAEWSPNEKVAFDVAVGAAYAGKRAIATMKHVGVNVAADSLFYSSFTGMEAGFVLICADDPGMHSSSNEQDNRNYAKFAKLPMLDPTDSEEAKQFVGEAMEISEKFDTPVMVRSTTRISHSRTIVNMEEDPVEEEGELREYEKNPTKYVMIPAYAKGRHEVVEDRMQKLAEFAEETSLNRIEPGNDRLGIIASGVAYQYAREVFPDATFLKLGMAYPLPRKLFQELAERVDKVLIIEEGDPFYEEFAQRLGLEVIGKDVLPKTGEFDPALIRDCARKLDLLEEDNTAAAAREGTSLEVKLPNRPPMLCPGCGHRGIFYVLQRLKVSVFGDIGCYTLGAAPPLNALHACGCMGASFGVVHGVDKAGVKGPTVGMLGDSTFFHSGVAPLINMVYNKGVSTAIIMDNRITAMTGHQDHPGTGRTLQEETVPEMDIEKLCRGIGVEKIDTVNPYQLKTVRKTLKDHLDTPEPSVIIARYPCVLNIKEENPVPTVDLETCNGCNTCLKIGCPPLLKEGEHVAIDPLLCNGCGYCIEVCPRDAIKEASN